MSMSTASSQWVPAPYTDLHDLCTKSLHPTSDSSDYANIMNFAVTQPHLFHLLPDMAFNTLILECNVECDRPDCTCDKSHLRRWISNIHFLNEHDKLRLTTEFRVVLYNKCELPMYFDQVMKNLALWLPSAMPNVRSIKFLGAGIFSPETVKYTKPSSTDAAMAVKTITKLFPNVTEVRSHTSRVWGPTSNISFLNDEAFPFYGYLLKECLAQLLHVQMLIPFPKNVTKLCVFLASISINIKYVRLRQDLPGVPIRCLRIVELFQIDDVIPWWLFEAIDGELDFESLEDLRLEFIHEAKSTVDDLGCDVPVRFPKLNRLHVTNSSYVYTDIYGYFRDCELERLTIRDEPTNFKHIKEHALANVKVLTIAHPQRATPVDLCSIETVEHLYNLPSRVEEAVLVLFQYPLPLDIAWVNLRLLSISTSIADKHGLANLLKKLPLMRRLAIDCFSMIRADAKLTKFPDQMAAFSKLGKTMKPKDRSPLNMNLERLELTAHTNFDLYGFCELLSRLPKVNSVKVKQSMISQIMDLLITEFRMDRHIILEPYLQ